MGHTQGLSIAKQTDLNAGGQWRKDLMRTMVCLMSVKELLTTHLDDIVAQSFKLALRLLNYITVLKPTTRSVLIVPQWHSFGLFTFIFDSPWDYKMSDFETDSAKLHPMKHMFGINNGSSSNFVKGWRLAFHISDQQLV